MVMSDLSDFADSRPKRLEILGRFRGVLYRGASGGLQTWRLSHASVGTSSASIPNVGDERFEVVTIRKFPGGLKKRAGSLELILALCKKPP